MTPSLHDQAMATLDRALELEAEGKLEAARQERERAAELEASAADAVLEQHPRTRGILRVGAVSLWIQAGRYDEAERLARRYLSEPLSAGFGRELHELLDQIAMSRLRFLDLPTIPDTDVAAARETLRAIEDGLASGRVPLVNAHPRAA